MYLQVKVPAVAASAYTGFCANLGHALINYVEVEIGGQRIDKHYGEWLHIWNELTQTKGKEVGYDRMVGASIADASGTSAETTMYIPLQFWFKNWT
jgi:hypothetical protein